MVNISSTLSLITLATATSALQVKFERWSREGCEDLHHIRKDTHLDSNKCKTFSHNEPVFHSFRLSAEDDEEDMENKFCQATIFDEEECHGTGFTYGDMLLYADKCGNTTVGGRSVYISCADRTDNIFTYPLQPVDVVTETLTLSSGHSTTTETIVVAKETDKPVLTSTLILYPHRLDDDDEGECELCLDDGDILES